MQACAVNANQQVLAVMTAVHLFCKVACLCMDKWLFSPRGGVGKLNQFICFELRASAAAVCSLSWNIMAGRSTYIHQLHMLR